MNIGTRWILPVVQALFVIVLVLLVYAVSWVGTTYTFKASPVDPYDPLLGEFVYLEYDIFQENQNVKDGTVYVSFTEDEDGYGKIARVSNDSFFGGVKGNYYDNRIMIWQFEQFYVEQGLGPELNLSETLYVEVDVSPWGMVRPKSISNEPPR